MASWGEIT